MAIATEFPRVLLFPETVTLLDSEWKIAHLLGRLRRGTNRSNRVHDRQVGKANPLRVDVLGAVAELAFSRATGLAPDLDTASRQGSWDAVLPSGRTVDVKATELPEGRLIMPVYKDRLSSDEVPDLLVLARVRMEGSEADEPRHTDPPPVVEFVGWAPTEELMQPSRVVQLRKPTYVLEDRELGNVLGILHASDDGWPGEVAGPDVLDTDLDGLMSAAF